MRDSATIAVGHQRLAIDVLIAGGDSVRGESLRRCLAAPCGIDGRRLLDCRRHLFLIADEHALALRDATAWR
jgi:hypothetical protein